MIARASRNILSDGGARAPNKCKHAECEGDIRRRRDGPAAQRRCIAPCKRDVDQDRPAMPPTAAIAGSAALDKLDNSPRGPRA